MTWVTNNWYVIVGVLALVTLTVVEVYSFIKEPKEQKIKNVKEWLKWAVEEAERELGSGTGQLKLRYVYDLAITKFPWLASMIPFDTFSDWVDEALEWLDSQLLSNKAVKERVNG